jgi:hypothetical protein
MKILNGWKEIAEYLQRTPRSARRWERLGLPVRRISASRRSPILAFSDEVEDWLRKKNTQVSELDSTETNCFAYRQTRDETRRLVDELRATRAEHRRLLTTIREQIRKK